MATDTQKRNFGVSSEFLADINARYETMQPGEIVEHALHHDWFSRPAVVSSFGAEAVVLLRMISRVRPDLPVIFIDTGKLFGETLRYRDRLQHVLGLEDVRTVGPRLSEVADLDPMGLLNRESPDACCDLRKTKVLERAMVNHDSWINGRKRYQSHSRTKLSILEKDENDRLKLTPLADWTAQDIRDYIIEENLPMHPLVKQGYLSIGCFPCTSKVPPGEDPRAGRWQGSDKVECGIHAKSQKP